jgi:hypothetical protein
VKWNLANGLPSASNTYTVSFFEKANITKVQRSSCSLVCGLLPAFADQLDAVLVDIQHTHVFMHTTFSLYPTPDIAPSPSSAFEQPQHTPVMKSLTLGIFKVNAMRYRPTIVPVKVSYFHMISRYQCVVRSYASKKHRYFRLEVSQGARRLKVKCRTSPCSRRRHT